MDPNNIDKQFFDKINNDQSELNFDELQSKESIWDKLEVSQEVVVTNQKPSSSWIWKAAAAMLLLGLSAFALVQHNNLNTEKEKYQDLKNEYNKVNQEVVGVKDQIKLLDDKISKGLQEKVIAEKTGRENDSNKKNTTTTIYKTKVDTQYIERIITVRDTIVNIQKMQPQEIIKYVKDTVFVKTPPIIADINKDTVKINNNIATKTKTPKKVEFIFGPKPLDKPNNSGIQIEVNGSVIAKKQKN